jgi:type I restriction enzyme S subunit
MDIQGLKDKILQLAIQGKLVEQDENDEPASVLLERIKEERDKLVKEKKIRKQKPLPEVTDEEKPFEIPGSWEWVRFGNLVEFKIGKTPKRSNLSYWDNGKYPWFSISDIKDGEIIYNSKEKISEKAYIDIFKGEISPKGTLIMSFKLSIGKMSILGVDGFHNEAIISIFPIYDSKEITKMYLFKIMDGLDILGDSKSAVKGVTLNTTSLNNILIPLPPLAEQKRIVEKVDELFALTDELDSNKEELLEVINLTRNQVLQEAIQGKLVEQSSEDEPASALVQRIKEERDKLVREGKIRKPKKLPPIEEEEKPFEIPEGWEWVRLGEIGDWGSGATPKRSNPKYYENGTIPWLKTGELNDGYIKYSEEHITEEAVKETSVRMNQIGDVLIAMYGATIGKLGILEIEATTNQACCACTPFMGVFNRYLFYYLLSQRKSFKDKSEGGAQPNISKEKIVNHFFPLPPLAEQKRIVKKVDTIMDMLDELEKELIINI